MNYMDQARQILNDANGNPSHPEQRQQKAVELAALMLNEALNIQTYMERREKKLLARMMNDPQGKAFSTSMADQCFRSQNNARIADQLTFLIDLFGIPKFLSPFKKFQLQMFKFLGKPFSSITVPLVKRMLRKEMAGVILPGEPKLLSRHMQQRRRDGVRVNLNHLGEAILGENEAERRLNIYLNDLANPEVEYISIKISTIYSQLSLLGCEDTLNTLSVRLKRLYRFAKENLYTLPDGTKVPKFVNLDMEEYRDLNLTVTLFKRVLDDAEFYRHSAGIVLQAYLPDAHLYQQELTVWAMQRFNNGGAPIKIRIVKGANLAMEQVESALKGWPQAPYHTKAAADANYKRMLVYASNPERAKAVHIGVASHNLFDIAYAMLIRAENKIEDYMTFEMLEGMADPIRRVVQSLTNSMLLYCPAATSEEFQNAVAYLIRRLDENTAPENFLRHVFEMQPNTPEWQSQADLFIAACRDANDVGSVPGRRQSRLAPPFRPSYDAPFENEADTDWALPQNVKWAEMILREWSEKLIGTIPLVIGGNEVVPGLSIEKKKDPSYPEKELYRYASAGPAELEIALQTAEKGAKAWSERPLSERLLLIDNAAHQLRMHRADLIGAMIADTAKTVAEADVEVSEAIDFAAYYRRSMEELSSMEDIRWQPKGPVLVAPPWNFPCSIPVGGIIGALVAGNSVIFKPAPEAVLVGWQLVKALWGAGIGKDVLQFFCCSDDPVGTSLIRDPRLAVVVLTGATSTAKRFLKLRPGMDLIAETGGKNALIVTSMSDRDLAIKDLLQSAFGHAGQKCSACSLAILESEVYDDPHFRKQLLDAAVSMKVGLPWDLSTKVNPLIREAGPELLRGLTVLEDGEEWLLKPQQDAKNGNLWSPGIKLGVKPGSFTHRTELFGPVLGIMRAKNLKQAIDWANATPYGLTAGIHTLDEREQEFWSEHIIAGNCYINRTITGAVVRRQPFGGCKDSSFGPGAKAGGPNYVLHLMRPQVISLPLEREPPGDVLKELDQIAHQGSFSEDELDIWTRSLESYTYFWNHYFSRAHDPSRVQGQDNFLRYVPQKGVVLRVMPGDQLLDILRVAAAAKLCGTNLEISVEPGRLESVPALIIIEETEEQLIKRVKRLRLLSEPSEELKQALADAACHVIVGPVFANGRIELLNYLREVSFSVDYHRYGYLGLRENL